MAKPPTRGDRAITFIEHFCKIPSGAMVGQPLRLMPFQKDFIRGVLDNPAGTRQAYLSIGRKNGKGLALDTPIPTPSGWTTMGKLREGDVLLDETGQPCSVEFLSPVHTDLRCWKLTFFDGSSVVADEQHKSRSG
jgi:hypothetical protein